MTKKDNVAADVEDSAADEFETEVALIDGGVTPKVAAGGAAGAASIVLVFVLAQAGIEIPPEVSSALTTLIAFAAGWLKSA